MIGHPFLRKNHAKGDENLSQNLNYNQVIIRNDMNYNNQIYNKNYHSDQNEEDESLPHEETLNSEQINKLHVNLVKTNNLNVLNNRQANFLYSYNSIYEGNGSRNDYFNEELYKNQKSLVEVTKKSMTPKVMNSNNNGISTKESNDSSDSSYQNKKIVHDENFNHNQYNFPIYPTGFQNQPIIPVSKGKKLNFNNCMITTNANTGSQFNYGNSAYNNGYTRFISGSFSDNNFNYVPNNNEKFPNIRLMNSYNISNLPENAFSYNIDVPSNITNYKCNSEKKKIKKSKDEVDQTLFVINLDNILYGRDKRTTIMIRHIPNKYTTQSLLEEIDLNFKGKYDFFYLPMDFENQCNLGYAFINFVDPMHILLFYDIFKARKWKKYKSHKECDLSYAKFQGKLELTSHLEKSWVMNKISEDKKPIILTPPEPLPKVEIPSGFSQLFKILYPNMINKAIFLK